MRQAFRVTLASRIPVINPKPISFRSSFPRYISNTRIIFNKRSESDEKDDRKTLDSHKSFGVSGSTNGEQHGTAPAEQGSRGYVPRLTYERVSYEYPPASAVNSAGQRRGKDGKIILPKPVESGAWRRHFPAIAAVVGVLWAVYAYKYFLSGEKTSDVQALEPDKFTTFKITYKEDVGEDLQLIEFSPRNYEEVRKIIKSRESLWNGKNLWSVDVRQPEIQVVRKYTPLPLYYMQGGLNNEQDGSKSPALLRALGSSEDEGRFVLLVKKYNDGEVSKWLHRLPIGTLVDIRGPYVGYRYPFSPIDKALPPRPPMEDLPSRMAPEDFPDERAVNIPVDEDESSSVSDGVVAEVKPGFWNTLRGGTTQKFKRMMVTSTGTQIPLPENIAFFAGGTGIAPVLQSLFSLNPPRGFVDVYYSVRDRSEVPFPRFLLFLEKAGRAKFHIFVDNENKFLKLEDVPSPNPMQYKGYSNKKLERELEKQKKLEEAMAVIKQEREDQKKGNREPQVPPPVTSSQVELPSLSKSQVSEDEANIKDDVSKAIVGVIEDFETSVQKTEPLDYQVDIPNPENPRVKYRSILEQATDRKATGADAAMHAQGPSLAVVCGPPGYVEYMAGKRDAANKSPIRGLLGQKGWDLTNTFRME